VTKLQAAAFEGSNQITALNLTVACLERAQRGDNEPTREDEAKGDAFGAWPAEGHLHLAQQSTPIPRDAAIAPAELR
jgi:hypothetical protein